LTFACSLKIKAVSIGIVDLILLMLLFSDPERSVKHFFYLFFFFFFFFFFSVFFSFFLESSGYQCQERIKLLLKHFSILGDTQMLLHILQGVKASMPSLKAV
jgi:hypothetical protein